MNQLDEILDVLKQYGSSALEFNAFFAAIVASNYPLTVLLDANDQQLYPAIYASDTKTLIEQIPNLFVFSSEYEPFALTTQEALPLLVKKMNEYADVETRLSHKEFESPKYSVIPFSEFLSNKEDVNDYKMTTISLIKILIRECSVIIENEFYDPYDQDGKKSHWESIKITKISWSYLETISNQMHALFELLNLLKLLNLVSQDSDNATNPSTLVLSFIEKQYASVSSLKN